MGGKLGRKTDTSQVTTLRQVFRRTDEYQSRLFRSGMFYWDQWVRSFYSTESQILRKHARNPLNLALHSCRVMYHFPSQVVFMLYQNDASSSILVTNSSVSLT